MSGPVQCPRCGGYQVAPGPWPWYLGAVGAMIVSAKVCMSCRHEFDANKPEADLGSRKLKLALIINGLGLLGILAIFGGLILLAVG